MQLGRYLAGVARGDFGYSLAYQQPVAGLVFSRVPATLLLMLTALLLSTTGGVCLGVEAARREGSLFDRAVTAFAAMSDAVRFSVVDLIQSEALQHLCFVLERLP